MHEKPIDIKKEATRYASVLHNKWRDSRKQIEGTAIDGLPKREERWKLVNPKNPDGPQIDIANTPFDQLPPAWQNENYLSAETATLDIADLSQKSPGVVDLEEAAARTHVAWKHRNPWATGEQAGPYSDLSPEEKNKDRVVIQEAITGLKENEHDLKIVNTGWAKKEWLEKKLKEKRVELQNAKDKDQLELEISTLDRELRQHTVGSHMDSPYDSYDKSLTGTEGAKPPLPTSYPEEEDRYGFLDGETRTNKENRKNIQ